MKYTIEIYQSLSLFIFAICMEACLQEYNLESLLVITSNFSLLKSFYDQLSFDPW